MTTIIILSYVMFHDISQFLHQNETIFYILFVQTYWQYNHYSLLLLQTTMIINIANPKKNRREVSYISFISIDMSETLWKSYQTKTCNNNKNKSIPIIPLNDKKNRCYSNRHTSIILFENIIKKIIFIYMNVFDNKYHITLL